MEGLEVLQNYTNAQALILCFAVNAVLSTVLCLCAFLLLNLLCLFDYVCYADVVLFLDCCIVTVNCLCCMSYCLPRRANMIQIDKRQLPTF